MVARRALFSVEIRDRSKDLEDSVLHARSEHESYEEAFADMVRLKKQLHLIEENTPEWGYACIEGPRGRMYEDFNHELDDDLDTDLEDDRRPVPTM